MQRRKFFRQSSLAVAGLMLHDELFAMAAQPNDEKVRLGIIGCGSRGIGIMHILKELSDKFEIGGICDIFDFRFKEAREAGVAGSAREFKDYRKMLDDKSISAVVIATPLYLHYAMACDALRAGKHLFLEKTMTYTIDESLELVKLAEAHPRQVLQIGHQLPYTPLYRQVKEMVGKGYLGKITKVECRYDRNGDWRRPVSDPALERAINWRLYKEYSGGLTAEILSHQMHFVNWTLNTLPNEVFSTGGLDFFKDDRDTYDNVQVMLRYNDIGVVGNFGSTLSNAREGFIFKIKGSKGTIELLFDDGYYYPEAATKKELETVDGVAGATKIEWNKEGGIPILKETMKDATWYAFTDFHKCITQQSKPMLGVVEGAASAITVHLANDSLYNHSVAKWKEEYYLAKGVVT